MKLVLVQPELVFEESSANAEAVAALLAPLAGSLAPDDVVLLPEHYDLRPSRADYERDVVELARTLGCHVVGGSHHEVRAGSEPEASKVNSGIAVDGAGRVVGTYEKLRPYAEERARVVQGNQVGEFRIGGRNILVLVCADFWFSDVFARARELPDLVLVPAFSVTRKPTPAYSRALWDHLCVARAYEFGAFVGVSDWAYVPGRLGASGVAGFADPTTVDPERFFRRVANGLSVYDLDFVALDVFRADRLARGFFWKRPRPAE